MTVLRASPIRSSFHPRRRFELRLRLLISKAKRAFTIFPTINIDFSSQR
jgi:hypothetical protein